MPHHRRILGLWIALPIWGVFACLLGACAAGPAASDDSSAATSVDPVQPDQRIAMLEASVLTLRDAGYAVDRADYRLGVVTSQPRAVATVLEPWHHRQQLAGDAWTATAGQLRRVVRIDFADDEPQAGPSAAAVPLRLQVQLERFEAPTQRLINASSGRIFSSLKEVPAPWADRGVTARYWRAIGRDSVEEQRLLRDLAVRFP